MRSSPYRRKSFIRGEKVILHEFSFEDFRDSSLEKRKGSDRYPINFWVLYTLQIIYNWVYLDKYAELNFLISASCLQVSWEILGLFCSTIHFHYLSGVQTPVIPALCGWNLSYVHIPPRLVASSSFAAARLVRKSSVIHAEEIGSF